MSKGTRLGRAGLAFATISAALGVSAAHAVNYTLIDEIPIPASPDNVNVSHAGGLFLTFDIADVNPATHLLYLADRSNASVDIFNTQSLSFVGRIGGSGSLGGTPAFGGQQASNALSGPDGVVVGQTTGQLYVGNGSTNPATNSTLFSFSLATNASTFTTNTGGAARVDELAFDPTRNRVIAANNADSPPFLSIIDGTTGAIIKKIVFDGTGGTPNAAGGIEAPVYDPVTDKYYEAIPQIGSSGPGGVTEIDPNTLTVTRTFDLAALGLSGACSPAGMTVGSDGRILVGCSAGTNTVLLDPRSSAGPNGAIQVVHNISGEDEVYFDPSLDLYFTSSRNDPSGPKLGIISGAGDLLQKVTTTPNDHSVAVDPTNNYAFVAAGAAGNALCPNGCMLVYASVPEPSSAPLVITALIGLLGMVGWRARREFGKQ